MKDLPIGEQSFDNLRKGDYVYIDKTAYVLELISRGGNYKFMSRPRRFGKSLLVSTIKAVFEGKKELFEGLYIYDKRNWEEKHPVVLLDMSQLTESLELLKRSIAKSLLKIADANHVNVKEDEPFIMFRDLIDLLYETTGQQVVVLVDEYDKPILDVMDDLEKASQIRSFLQSFYSVLKGSSDHLRFVFLTGVSKISQISIFSGLNNLNDITMNDKYAGICGYTQQELEDAFAPNIEYLANKFSESKEEMLAMIKHWYNGYSWDGKTFVYNPFSVLLLFDKGIFDAHWFATGTPTFLIRLIKKKNDLSPVLKTEIKVPGGFADTQSIEELDVVPLCFQTGYLTVKKFDWKENIYSLQIPNHEVGAALAKSILISYTGQNNVNLNKLALNIKNAFSKGNTAFAIENLRTLFSQVSYDSHVASESHYHALFQLTMNLMGIDHQSEVHNDNSRTDSVLKFPEQIYVIEIKYSKDKTGLPDAVKRAMQQIKDNEYYQPFLHQGKEVRLLALGFTKGGVEYEEVVIGEG